MTEEALDARERAFRESPDDAEVREGYERALRRAGDERRLRSFYSFELECPKQWHELEATSDPLVRHCETCQESVHFAATPQAFADHTAAGRCVAVLDQRQEELSEELAEGLAVDEAAPRPSCVVPGTWFDLLLDGSSLLPTRLGQGDATFSEELASLNGLVRAGGHSTMFDGYEAARRLRRERDEPPVLKSFLERVRARLGLA